MSESSNQSCNTPTRYFGKYRGKVVGNTDLMGLGRIQISCPAVLGEGSLSWAMPCLPYAGDDVGFFVVPPEGANIWVEFEAGNPDYPIWSGCFWGNGEMPSEAEANTPFAKDHKVFKTDTMTLIIDDQSDMGGVSLEIIGPAVTNDIKLVCDSNGVKLTVGDDVSATLTAEDITVAVGEDVSGVLNAETITLSVGDDTSTVWSADGIEMTGAAESTVNLTSSSIEAANGDSSATIESSALTLAVSSSEGKWESSGIELSNGSGSVKVESSGVNINSGAVEVK